MDNKKVAEIFEEMGDILEIKGESFFRVNAYRKGALTVRNLGEDLRVIAKEGAQVVAKIPGIGKALSEKIVELMEDGRCRAHEEMKRDFPIGLLEILKVRGLGPKKVKLFYESLGIETIARLKAAAEGGELRVLEKMGEKSEAEIITAITEFEQFANDRVRIDTALLTAEKYLDYMKKLACILQISYAGSLRRSEETIGDIDILVSVEDAKKVKNEIMKRFVNYSEVKNILAEGETKASVILISGVQVDLRLVERESFGAALHYFTGSKAHNVKVRDVAKKMGMKVNEYGLFRGEEKIAGETEEEMFAGLGLCYIPPELRKDDGEVEYAATNKQMPDLVRLEDIKGDLHSHSTYSDGKESIEEMARVFENRGYEYFAVTDHSQIMGVTGGMNAQKIKRQWKEIDEVQKKVDIKILKGCEVDILKDGSLDFEEDILKGLDVVIASAHLHGRLDYEEQTKRLIMAIESGFVTVLGHPTGRLINKRAEMEFDMAKVAKAAAVNGVAMEINSNPMRLDLPDKYLKMAKDLGVKFAINTDSHDIDHVDFMKFGVGVARRGWLSKSDVINTVNLTGFLKAL